MRVRGLRYVYAFFMDQWELDRVAIMARIRELESRGGYSQMTEDEDETEDEGTEDAFTESDSEDEVRLKQSQERQGEQQQDHTAES